MRSKLPSFICVGAQKAATTSLHDILRKHPDIFLPERKEAHFFDNDERYQKGLDWWKNTFFSNYNNEKVIGVMTPEYLFYEEVPLRIYEDLGKDTKIIIILRNPVDRAYSHYLMSLRREFENLSFQKAIELENDRIKDTFGRNHFSYISRGLYYEQVSRYYNLFGKDNVKVYLFEEDFIKNKNHMINDIQDFLEVPNIELNIDIKSNKATTAKYKVINSFLMKESFLKNIARKLISASSMKEKIYNFLSSLNQKEFIYKKLTTEEKKSITIKFFREDINKTAQLIDRDLSEWTYNAQ